MKVYACNIRCLADSEAYLQFFPYASPEKKKQLIKYRQTDDIVRSLIGELLTQMMICQQFNMQQKDLTFGYNAYGKPYLENNRNIFFNVSHANDWVVCAIDEAGPVGVDIEKIRTIDIDLADHCFSPLEYEQLLCQPSEEQLSYFYRIWTLKESFVKAHGKGLSMPLNSFSFLLHGNQFVLQCDNQHNAFTQSFHIPFIKDYYIAVTATSASSVPQAVHNITIEDIAAQLHVNTYV